VTVPTKRTVSFCTNAEEGLAPFCRVPTAGYNSVASPNADANMQYDAIIVGDSYAGLSAGVQLARARREVCIICSGQPGNGSVKRVVSDFPNHHEIGVIDSTLSELGRYPSLRTIDGIAVEARREGTGGFRVTLHSGESRVASKLLLAFAENNSTLARQLGCVIENGAFGWLIRTDPGMMTTVPGVYATGNDGRGTSDTISAVVDGILAGISIHTALL